VSYWVNSALEKIMADYQRSTDTHLVKLELPLFKGIDIYLKDESTHPTGSLKHRLARSLFLYALCNGKIEEGTSIIEASSGSTAVSEAYFARMLGLPFIAVMPRHTSSSKIKQIEHYGGRCHFVDCAEDMHSESLALAKSVQGYFMDQFTYAERATDWRGNNNIAESIFQQMELEAHPVPSVIVMGAGTGGTSATLGRYIRYKRYPTRLVVVDPDYSAYYPSYVQKDPSVIIGKTSRIEGIGRPRVEASFQPDIIDEMLPVPDGASVAAIHWLECHTGIKAGGSTGTNLWGALQAAKTMANNQVQGSVVTLMCDGGERYQDTYYNTAWVQQTIGDTLAYREWLDTLYSH
jgi:cysteine synthase A